MSTIKDLLENQNSALNKANQPYKISFVESDHNQMKHIFFANFDDWKFNHFYLQFVLHD